MNLSFKKSVIIYKIVVFLISLFLFVCAQDKALAYPDSKKYTYNLMIDRNMSSVSSAEIAMSLIESYRFLDERFLVEYQSKAVDSNNIAINASITVLQVVARFVVTSWIVVANHEIGGHGARGREFKMHNIRYTVHPFDGSTNFSNAEYNALHIHQKQEINIAGMEANYLLSENIKTRYIESENINPIYGISYIWSSLDQGIYIWGTKKQSTKEDGHDISNYIKTMNNLYDRSYLSIKKLHNYAYLDLLDPFLFYSVYSYIACDDLELMMIPITDNIRYLPATRLVLAPYGFEKKLINHIKIDNAYYQLSLSYGKNQSFKSYNLRLITNQILKFNKVNFGFDVAVWSQPRMLSSNPAKATVKTGGMLLIKSEFNFNDQVDFLAVGGYKSAGFVQGTPIASSGIVRIGVKLNF